MNHRFEKDNSNPLKILSLFINAIIYKSNILILSFIVGAFNISLVRADTISQDTASDEEEINKENILESVMSYSDDMSELFAKVDLNSASAEDLLSIPGMTSKFASSIVTYRRKSGFIYDVDELVALDGMTQGLLSSIKRHTHISPEENISMNVSSYTSFSPQKTDLYQDECNESGIMNFQKLHAGYRNFELDAVSDKDAGEKSYLDFYSLALSMKRMWIFSTVDIGDYDISLGNGLLFSNGGTVSKSAGAISPLFIKHAYSLKPECSRSESGFFRGIACSIPHKNFEFTGFASSKNLDAHVNDSGFVTSIDQTGLNLFSSSTRMNLREKIAGGILRFGSAYADFGASAVYFSYDRPFLSYYKQSQLAGDAFLRFQSEKTTFSGELLADKVVSFSANASLDYDETKFAVGLRNLRSHIVPNYSGTLSESFPTAPEQGIYFGATFRPEQIIILGFYYDRFRIMSTSGDPDRNGEEIFSDAYINLNHEKIFDGTATTIYIRYKYKTKEDFYIPETDFPAGQSTLAGSKQNFRLDLRHNFSSAFSIRTRFEKDFLSSGENGELFLFDAGWSLSAVSFNSRVCFYRTESYNSAFYEVEENLPGTNQYTLMYGDGFRLMVLTNLKVTKSLSMGMKFSRDIYDRVRQSTVGSASGFFQGVTYVSFEAGYNI